MAENVESVTVGLKKTNLTPKAIIHQRFGNNVSYKIEEVEESEPPVACPGLAIQRKGPCLYRCSLQLPEFTVVSDTFKRKKEAEQSAAEKAIEKLGINPTKSTPTVQEAWDELVARLSFAFSNEFLSATHPLSGQMRESLKRESHYNGFVPISAISVYDAKLISLCKCVDPNAESDPFLVMCLVKKAAENLVDSVALSEDKLSIRRKTPYSPEILEPIVNQESGLSDNRWMRAVRVPNSDEKCSQELNFNVSGNVYYLDVIAKELGVTDASQVLVSRPIGKASSEMRFYWSRNVHQSEESLNINAKYFSGQNIYGDAILACLGYTWRSTDLFYEDVSLYTYYRLLINKIPNGAYKLSRDSILASELPLMFTTRSNWRGSTPRETLSTCCRLHRLSEPIFPTVNTSQTSSSPDLPGSSKKLKVSQVAESNGSTNSEPSKTFKCDVKIFSKSQDLILTCSPKASFKKQSDSIQSASLKVLCFLNFYFKNLEISLEKLTSHANELDIQLYPNQFNKEFELCKSVHKSGQLDIVADDGDLSLKIEGQASEIAPSSGSLVSMSYSVCLVTEDEHMKNLLESCEEFEFEIGNGGVIPAIELVVNQMFVGQSAKFNTKLPRHELIVAACDSTRTPSLANPNGRLEYSITLLGVTMPLEDRMEQALFSPPLSKQRVEFALKHIKESRAASLVDFGCGSGSLLESLLEYSTSLEKINGVDISKKSLTRAAKVLHSKLNTSSSTNKVKSAFLFDGSITDFDSRLYGADIGTCLEVIEHMEEDQASLFGDAVLSLFCPKILIVSTPNYEYNIILQKSTVQSQDEDPEDKNQTQYVKFRNFDHKFEWTREQFNDWASDLAQRHHYAVEFSGVGSGVADVEPGFASQIAVFRRIDERQMMNGDESYCYDVIWEWSSCDRSSNA